MFVDYTDLNQVCSKDCYPLPRIDQLVDVTSGHELLMFMDVFLGYNQIQMTPRTENIPPSSRTEEFTTIKSCPSV